MLNTGNLNTFVNTKVWVDALGISSDKAIKVLEGDISGKILINFHSLQNFPDFFFRYIKPYVRYSIINNNNSESINSGTSPVVPLNYFRKSFFNYGFDLNLFTSEFRKNPLQFELNAGFYGGIAKYKTSSDDSISHNIYFSSFYFAPRFKFDIANNFGLEIGCKFLIPSFEENDIVKVSDKSYFNIFGMFHIPEFIYNPEGLVYFTPDSDRDNYLFFKVISLYKNNDRQVEFRIGYNINLNKYIGNVFSTRN